MWISRPASVAVNAINQVSRVAGVVAIVFLLVMMLFTVTDVILRYFFNAPIFGTYEMVELLLIVAGTWAMAACQIERRHITVGLLVERLPHRYQVVIRSIALFLSLGLYAIITWQMIDYGLTIQAAGGVTPIERIPLAPSIYATAACTLLMCFVLLVSLFKLVKGVRK